MKILFMCLTLSMLGCFSWPTFPTSTTTHEKIKCATVMKAKCVSSECRVEVFIPVENQTIRITITELVIEGDEVCLVKAKHKSSNEKYSFDYHFWTLKADEIVSGKY